MLLLLASFPPFHHFQPPPFTANKSLTPTSPLTASVNMTCNRQTLVDQRGYIFLFPSLGLPDLDSKGTFHLIRVVIGTEATAKKLLYDNKVEAPRRYAREGYAMFDLLYEGAVWIMPLVAAEKDAKETEVFSLLVQRLHPKIVPDPGRIKTRDGCSFFSLFHPQGLAHFQPPLSPEKLAAKLASKAIEADEKDFWADEENIKGVMTSEGGVPKTLNPTTEFAEGVTTANVYMKSRAGRRQRKKAEEQPKKDEALVDKARGHIDQAVQELRKRGEAKPPPAPLNDWPAPPEDVFNEDWHLEALMQAASLESKTTNAPRVNLNSAGISLRAHTGEDLVFFEYAVTFDDTGEIPEDRWRLLPRRAWKPRYELMSTNQVRRGMGMKTVTQRELLHARQAATGSSKGARK